MELFLLVVKFLPVGILFLILYNVKWGMIAYFLYIFLVPIPTLGVLPVSLLTLTLMGMSVYKFGVKKTKESLRVASPYLFLLLALGIVMPLTPTPFPFQFWIWRTDLINGMLPILSLWLLIVNSDISADFKTAIIVAAFISGIYALVLTQTDGINPYVFGLKLLSGADIIESWYADDNRLFGRISSTFVHPMTWAFVIGTLIIFIFYIRKQISKLVFILLMLILVSDMFFCGVRSVIGALIVFVGAYLVMKRQIKVFLYTILIGVVLLLILSTNDFLYGYVASIFDLSDKNEIANGSSFSMRLNQLSAAFKEMARSPIIGNGYGWHLLYLQKYGGHPDLLGFESLVFTVICDFGVWGVLVWICYIISLLILPIRLLKNKESVTLIQCFVLYYVAYACVTGDFAGYYFLWFYVIMVAISYREIKVEKTKTVLLNILMLKQNK